MGKIGYLGVIALVAAGCVGVIGGDGGDGGEGDPSQELQSAPPPQRVWLLTGRQFTQTAAALFEGWPTGPTFEVVTHANQTYSGTQAESLVLNTEQTERLVDGAEAMGDFVASRLDEFVSCQPADRSCFDGFFQELITRAWRSPPEPGVLDALRDVYDVGAEQSAADGYRLAVTAVMLSPRFSFRAEIGQEREPGEFELTSWETASLLSYLFWDAPPDAQLRALAEKDALRDPEVRRAEATRLLADPRARTLAAGFVQDLLAADSVVGMPKDTSLVTGFDEAVTLELVEEVRHFAEWLFFDAKGTSADLLLSPTVFMNERTAWLYGRDDVTGDAFQSVDMSAEHRFGVLTMPALLAQLAQIDHVVPTTRGRWVWMNLLCLNMGNPPEGAALPPGKQGLTPRERTAFLSNEPACAPCHVSADNIGFAFSNYDIVGRYITEENDAPIDASGFITGSGETDAEFEDLQGMANVIAKSPQYRSCLAEKYFEFSLGRRVADGDEQALDTIHKAFEEADGDLPLLLELIPTLEHFTVRSASE